VELGPVRVDAHRHEIRARVLERGVGVAAVPGLEGAADDLDRL
jgi:hypothetical protein